MVVLNQPTKPEITVRVLSGRYNSETKPQTSKYVSSTKEITGEISDKREAPGKMINKINSIF